ncbi:MAG: HNH endonuclease [Anaerolineae bacterium]|nr:HNH endonuclease [Anaerolineae bacterium]
MATPIPSDLRRLVAERARYRCEYCLLPQTMALHRHEPDHIVPLQHGGVTEAINLALACLRCNRYKGPNVGSFDPLTGLLVPLFHPRLQSWDQHFHVVGAEIRPLTPEGRVTVLVLRLNDPDRLAERQRLIEARLYW